VGGALGGEEWAPFVRRIGFHVEEGLPFGVRGGDLYEFGYDPTPYDSPAGAAAQTALLPLETGAGPNVSTRVLTLDPSTPYYFLRTPGVTDAMVDDHVLRCLRYFARADAQGADGRAAGWLFDNRGWIEARLWGGVGADSEEVRAALDRLIARGVVWRGDDSGKLYVTEPRPKCWSAFWQQVPDAGDGTPGIVAWISEELDGQDASPDARTAGEDTEPHGRGGPFRTEVEAREYTHACAVLHNLDSLPVTFRPRYFGPPPSSE
jgi:hypothetical protein